MSFAFIILPLFLKLKFLILSVLSRFTKRVLLNSPFKLSKEFKFKNFKESQKFINKVGDIAEKENHHPDISFGWGYCRVKIFTHAIKGLAESDFILAAKIDKI